MKTRKIGIFLYATLCIFAVLFSLSMFIVPTQAFADTVPQELYYGRNKLSGNNNLVGAYDAICKGVANKSPSISLEPYKLSKTDFAKVWELYRFDHTEHYWVPSKYSYTQTQDKTNILSLEFGTKDHPTYLSDFNDAKFQTEAKKYLDLTKNLKSQYEIALVLHDALVKDVTYDLNAKNAHNAYGAIVGKRAVCEGYAEAYQYLLQRCGIQSYLVTGTSHNEGHEWNLVRLDGNYYYTDVTWDDPVSNDEKNKPVYHAYFNVTTAILQKDHEMTDTYNVLPTCTKTDMLNKDMTVLSSYSVGIIAQSVKVSGKTGVAKIFLGLTVDAEEFDAFVKNQDNFSAIVAKTSLAGKKVSGNVSVCGREYILTITGPDAPATAVFLDRSSLELVLGKNPTAQLIATVKPEGYCSDAVVWMSDNPAVATVNQTGKVTAVGRGTAKIKATAGAKEATCTVTVAPECYHNSKTLVQGTASTCKTAGVAQHYVCSDCGKTVDKNGDEIDAELPLNPNNHEGATEVRNSVSATCAQAGFTGDTYCLGCGQMIKAGSEVPQGLHSYDESYTKQIADKKKHYHVCKACGNRDEGESHEWNLPSATETENKYCTICSYVAEVAANHTHNGVLQRGKSATCTVAGEKDYYECSSCGMFFADANCAEKVTDLWTWKVLTPAHDYGEPQFVFAKNCATATAKFSCKGCGESFTRDAVLTAQDTTEPSDTMAGERVYTAQVTVDGKTYTATKTQSIPPRLGYTFGGILRLCTFGGAINCYLGFGLVIVVLLLLLIITFKILRRRHRKKKKQN